MNIMKAFEAVTYTLKMWVDENKVQKVVGKGLSTNDYTTADKNKVANIPNDLVILNGKLYLAQDGAPLPDSDVTLSGGGTSSVPNLTSVTISAGSWSGADNPYSQVVVCNDAGTNSKPDLQPTPEQLVELQDAEISLMATNTNGVITVYAFNDKPQNDMTIQVLMTEVTGYTNTIYGNVIGGGSGFGKTVLLEDEAGNQLVGILVDEEVLFTATADDIKVGKVAGTDSGVVVGTHVCD